MSQQDHRPIVILGTPQLGLPAVPIYHDREQNMLIVRIKKLLAFWLVGAMAISVTVSLTG